LAHSRAEHAESLPERHVSFGAVSSKLILTFIGGVLVLNAYLADRLIFRGRDVAGDMISAQGAVSALLGALILGVPIVIGGIKEIKEGKVHMAVLVSLAVLAAFATEKFHVAGIVAFFMLLASLIEQKTAQGARESIEKLMKLAPREAELADGRVVPVSELAPGDIVRLRPGDAIPVDGRVLRGESTVNEATITGEALPADKLVGDEVFAGTNNLTGYLEVEVIKAGEDTTLGKVKELILRAEATKSPVMQMIDQYAEWYTPVVLMIAAIIFVFTKDWTRVVTALVVSVPGAFVLATPTAMVAGLSAAARLGVLVKNVGHLEAAGGLTAIVFDKTGTLTTGEMTVTRMSPAEGVDGAELLEAAASVEQHSRHPLARAICKVAQKANLPLADPENVQETAGKGVSGALAGTPVMVGRKEWLCEQGMDMSSCEGKDHAKATAGMSLLYVAKGGTCIGWIGFEDRAREEAKKATTELRELGVNRLAVLTGDRWNVARKLAAELGCTEVQAECLPEQKLQIVETMRRQRHHVAVVGDGVNDAPALAAGDLGIAMGAAGSDVAIDSASIALMSNDLRRLPFLIRLSRRLHRVILQNLLFGAVFVIGGLLLATFKHIGPVAAAILYNVSSFIVIFNSARLVRFGENLSPYSGAVVDRVQHTPVVT